MSSWATVFSSALGIFFLVAGSFALLWCDRIQSWILRLHEKSSLKDWNPFLRWMRTPSYTLSLRALGLLSIATGFFILFLVAV